MQLGNIQRWNGREDLPKVICLHGFLGNGLDFEILTTSDRDHPTLIAPDLPDYTKPPPAPYTWDGCLSALNQLIDSESKDAPCVLLGYSMGGRIALQYAARYPHRLAGLVLVGATPGITEEDEKQERIKKDQALADTLRTQPLDTFLEKWFNQDIIQSQAKIPEPHQSRMRKHRASNNPEALAEALAHLGTGSMTSVWNKLAVLTMPTLIVTGESDTKFDEIARQMKESLIDATHVCIEDAGHACCFEQPETFAQSMTAFLSTLNG